MQVVLFFTNKTYFVKAKCLPYVFCCVLLCVADKDGDRIHLPAKSQRLLDGTGCAESGQAACSHAAPRNTAASVQLKYASIKHYCVEMGFEKGILLIPFPPTRFLSFLTEMTAQGTRWMK